jgi:hypothetical protein
MEYTIKLITDFCEKEYCKLSVILFFTEANKIESHTRDTQQC